MSGVGVSYPWFRGDRVSKVDHRLWVLMLGNGLDLDLSCEALLPFELVACEQFFICRF